MAKPVIITKVANGINKAEELITEAMSGKAPIYRSKGTDEAALSQDGEGLGRKIYKSLMNGVSHMLPFVIGGGILIAPVLPGGQRQCGSRGLWIRDAALRCSSIRWAILRLA